MAENFSVIRPLSARQYTPGCPLVVGSGQLVRLDGTGQSAAAVTLVNISDAPIAAARVRVRCLDSAGTELAGAERDFAGLSVSRGGRFGGDTPMSLPEGNFARYSVTVPQVTFADGTVWACPEDAVWGVLPGFTPLEKALTNPKALSRSRELLPGGKYAYAAPADLWYCTCGGLNHARDRVCYRCGRDRTFVADGASPARLTALLAAEAAERERIAAEEAARRREAREQARQEAAEKAAAKREAAALAAARRKEAARQKAEQKQAAKAEAAAAKEQAATEPSGEPSPKSGKKKLLVTGIAVLLLAAIAGGAVLLLGGRQSAADAQEPPTPGITILPTAQPAAPEAEAPDTGVYDEARVYVHPGENGRCLVDPELVLQYIPDATTSFFTDTRDLGDDIEPYLKNSFSFAALIRDGTGSGISGEGNAFDPAEDSGKLYCLLVFRYAASTPRLIGYYVGSPVPYDEDTWYFPVRLCDYDLTDLCARESNAFSAGKAALLEHYIAPEDAAGCGAVWYLQGFNTGRDPDMTRDDCQMYHLWQQLNSDDPSLYAREISRFSSATVNAGRWKCFLLLDKNYDLIGYTVLHNE